MKYTFRILLSMFMLVCMGDIVSALPTRVYIDPAAAIDASAVAVNSATGDFFACTRDGSNITIVKYDQLGVIDATFGTAGTQVLTVSTAEASATNIQVVGYAGFTVGSEFLITCNSVGEVVLAFTVDVGLAGTGVVVRLNSGGILDADFGTDGVLSLGNLTTAATDDVVELSSLATSFNNVIIAAYVEKASVNSVVARTARVFKVTDAGELDATFDTNGIKDLDVVADGSLVTKSRRGLSVVVDASDDILVAGKFGPQFLDTPDYPHGVYCVKLATADGTIDTTFGVAGRYISDHISGVTDNKVFVIVDEIDSVTSIQLIFSQSSTMAVHQLDADGTFNFAFGEDGVFERDYGLAGVAFPGTLDVKGAGRDGEGRLYVAGSITLTDGGTTTSYLARFTTDGALDSTYITATSTLALAAGVVNVAPTTDDTVDPVLTQVVALGEGGKMAFYNDATDALIFGFEETWDDPEVLDEDRFVFMIGDPIDFTVPDSVTEPCILASVIAPTTYVPPTAGLDQEFPIIFSSNAPDIGDAHVGTNNHDEIITAIRADSVNQFRLAKFDPRGNFVDAFGNQTCGDGDWCRVITVGRYKTPAISTAVVDKYLNMTAGQNSYMAFDSSNNIFIAFMVDVANGVDIAQKVVVMKMLDETGALDLDGFNAGAFVSGSTPGTGTFLIDLPDGTSTLEGLTIDANNKAVVAVHHDDGAGVETGLVYRLTSAGILDTSFDTDGQVTLAGTVNDALVGLGLTTDKDGNVFIGGQQGTTDAYKLFCMKLDVANGDAVTAFGSSGLYASAVATELDGAKKVYLLEYQYDHDGTIVDNLQIITQGTSSSAAAVVMYQLDVTTGALETAFGGDGISIIPFATLTSLDGAERTQEGYTLLSGIMTEETVKKGFQARVHHAESGDSLDTDHGQDSLGLSKVLVTPTWTMSGRVPVDLDSGNGLAFGFVECDTSTPAEYRLVIMRFLGHAEHYTRHYNGGNFDEYLIAHALDTLDELKEYIDFTYGILPRLRTQWAADHVGDVSTAETLFVGAVDAYLGHFIDHAGVNSATSQLLLPHKFGDLTGLVTEALGASSTLSSGDKAAALTGVITALDEITTGLDLAIKIVTDVARQTQQ